MWSGAEVAEDAEEAAAAAASLDSDGTEEDSDDTDEDADDEADDAKPEVGWSKHTSIEYQWHQTARCHTLLLPVAPASTARNAPDVSCIAGCMYHSGRLQQNLYQHAHWAHYTRQLPAEIHPRLSSG